jgi:hypothetical protein
MYMLFGKKITRNKLANWPKKNTSWCMLNSIKVYQSNSWGRKPLKKRILQVIHRQQVFILKNSIQLVNCNTTHSIHHWCGHNNKRTLKRREKKCVGWLSKNWCVEGGKGKEFLAKACQKEVQGWLAPPPPPTTGLVRWKGLERAGWSAAEHCHVSENEVKSKHRSAQCVCASERSALSATIYTLQRVRVKGLVGLFPFSWPSAA